MDDDDGANKLGWIVRQGGVRKEQAAEHYSRQSRERLRRNIETKIRTTMIGALSLMEAKFGHLWGQGKPRTQLTDQELAMEELKDELRTEILNNGNNQLRAAIAEIGQYDVTWNRYQYSLEAGGDDIPRAFGIDENGNPKKPRYGTNSDGSIKVREDQDES
jgi:hypothetical protein